MKITTSDGQVVEVPPGGKVFVDGMEVCDPTPVEMPIGAERPETLESMMLRMIHNVSAQAARAGLETLDEANDYEIDDEDDFTEVLTGHELRAMMESRELKEEVPNEERKAGRPGRRDAAGGSGEEDAGEDQGSPAGEDSSEDDSAGDQRFEPGRVGGATERNRSGSKLAAAQPDSGDGRVSGKGRTKPR